MQRKRKYLQSIQTSYEEVQMLELEKDFKVAYNYFFN